MDAVIMTGGKGLRMRPYTQVLPKGLLPVGGQPILEILIKQLKCSGFQRITMACGYLANMIRTYFDDGSKWGVSLSYLFEECPLGTVGPLKLLPPVEQPFLMVNCDVLTNLDFRELYRFHEEEGGLLTIASQDRQIPIDLGVLETEDHLVVDFVEKPAHTVTVSMGMYVVDPRVIRYIPENRPFDVPDLICALLAERKKIRHFKNDAFWIDIGKPEDYERANEQFRERKEELLPENGR